METWYRVYNVTQRYSHTELITPVEVVSSTEQSLQLAKTSSFRARTVRKMSTMDAYFPTREEAIAYLLDLGEKNLKDYTAKVQRVKDFITAVRSLENNNDAQ